MKTMNAANHPHPSLEQLRKDTCLWIGHMEAGHTDHLAGQTFHCPEEGILKKIQVYSIAVVHPGKIILTIHEFEKQTKSWGNALSSSEIGVDENDAGQWMQFPLHSIRLQKDIDYGFRLQSPDTFIAIGETAWPSKSPFEHGEEWCINNLENEDHYYKYFSLAFKVDLRAA